MSVPMTVAMIAAAMLGVADPKAGTAAIMAVQAGGVQSQINFTRTNEAEADNLGMLTLVRSGFDAQAMPAFFERLQQTSRFYSTDAIPDFLRTHPVTTERIADARGRAVTYPVQPQLSDGLQFYLMREKVRVSTTDNLGQLLSYYESAIETGNSANQTATKYGYSLALLEAGNTTKARQMIQTLIDNDPDRLSYQLALAKIEMAVGRTTTALGIYDKYQRLYPNDQALTLEQVEALILDNNPSKATELLKRQLDLGYASRKLYQQLARTTGDMGKKSESHMWFAEYYYSSGRLNQAADQLRIAAGYAKGDEFQLSKISSRLRDIELMLAQMEK
jgi:predicted Zn-dependent protease